MIFSIYWNQQKQTLVPHHYNVNSFEILIIISKGFKQESGRPTSKCFALYKFRQKMAQMLANGLYTILICAYSFLCTMLYNLHGVAFAP